MQEELQRLAQKTAGAYFLTTDIDFGMQVKLQCSGQLQHQARPAVANAGMGWPCLHQKKGRVLQDTIYQDEGKLELTTLSRSG